MSSELNMVVVEEIERERGGVDNRRMYAITWFGRMSGDPINVLGKELKLRISQQVSFLVEAFFFLPPSSPRSLTT